MKETLSSILKFLLFPLALLYGAGIFLRNKLYDAGFLGSVKFDQIPVISVGNLSVGGTGKTPHVEYLLRLLSDTFHTATLSRGYKRFTRGFRVADNHSDARQIGDEPLQYKKKFQRVIVSVAEDRVTAIPELLQRAPFLECIILDDAFQHRSVQAGLSLLITDYSRRYSRDFILPFGRLRENRKAAKRADIILVSKCPATLSLQEKSEIIQELHIESHQKIFFSRVEYEKMVPLENYMLDPEGNILQTDRKAPGPDDFILLICGIANPQPLIQHLKKTHRHIHVLTYRDHHYFTEEDLQEIHETFQNIPNNFKQIITTEKDAMRLALHFEKLQLNHLPVWVLPIEVQILFGEKDTFDTFIKDYVHSYFPVIDENEFAEEINPYFPKDDDDTVVDWEEIE